MRKVWAVAINTVRQALRMKIAIIFTILLLILLPVMGLSITGDGTLKGRLQSFINYSFALMNLLLSVLTVVVSIYTLTNDLKQKQIYTVLTKPIRRFQLLLGKLIGVVLLDIILLVVFSGIIYVGAVYIPEFSKADKEEVSKVKNEFFTARASLTPAEYDVSGEALKTFNELKEKGELPDIVTKNKSYSDSYLNSLSKQIKQWKRAVPVGNELFWEFENVKPLDPNASLFIRFKYDVAKNPPDLCIYSSWFVGDNRPFPPEGMVYNRKDLIRTPHEMEVPASVVAKDGHLAVGFINIPRLNDTTVIFPPQDGFEVLYKASTFGSNFLRAVLLILIRLIFLACLGVLTSTFLSFPVAILVCFAVFFTGIISGFVLESFETLSQNIGVLYHYTIRLIVLSLPQFDRFGPGHFLLSSRLISWPFLAEAAGIIVGIKAFVLLIIALLIFRYKELAKISV